VNKKAEKTELDAERRVDPLSEVPPSFPMMHGRFPSTLPDFEDEDEFVDEEGAESVLTEADLDAFEARVRAMLNR